MSIEQQKIFAKPPQSYWMASTPKANYPTLEEDIKLMLQLSEGYHRYRHFLHAWQSRRKSGCY